MRNPHFHVWSGPAQPAGLPDTIELSTNLKKGKGAPSDTTAAFRATAAGRVDYTVGGVPADLLASARTQYPAQLHVTPAPSTNWVILNTRKPPFDNVHARRALAFALDRGRMVANAGGADLATPTCQLLPPGLAGYRPYCPFTAGDQSGAGIVPDLGQAQAELQKSGTHGAHVRVVTTDQTSGVNRANLEVAATLRQLGYRVTVKHYAADPGYFNAIFGDARHIDAVALGWIQDYPAPSNFFGGINCPPLSPYMCSKAYARDLAHTAAAATASGSSDPWTAFDRKVTDSAVVIPYLNLKAIDFVSKRLGNYQHHPEYDLLIDQVWVR